MSVCSVSEGCRMNHRGRVCNSYRCGVNRGSSDNRGSIMNGVMDHRRIMNEGAGSSQNLGVTIQYGGISIPFDNSVSEGKSGISISESMVSYEAVSISESMVSYQAVSVGSDRGNHRGDRGNHRGHRGSHVMYCHRCSDHGTNWGVMNDGCGGCQDLGVPTDNSSVSFSLSYVMATIAESMVSESMVSNCNRNGVLSNLMCDLSRSLNHGFDHRVVDHGVSRREGYSSMGVREGVVEAAKSVNRVCLS